MASVSHYARKYATGTGADIYIPITKRAVVDFAVSADWTPVAGDVKVSIDGGAAANITTLPVAVAMGNGAMWKFVFANAELTGKLISVTVVDAVTKAVEDAMFTIETFGNASALHPFDLDTASQVVASVTGAVGSIGTGGITSTSYAAGAINAAAIAVDAIGAAELAADAVTEIAAGVWAQTMTELAAVPAVTGTTLAALEWLFLLARNKVTQTSTTSTLRNNADGATIGTSTVSDDGTTFTKGKWA